ncbi:23S rRNA (uracil(1939)-C(5))-methyltransferase RlmD [Hujiaoplasma nucleasis]|uniref:23S rRNA (Uracil(1939)-C(5))-methyltransferase RlmD n=1 Tax=Hujiaoplasma nucleasis TaxID=2725268 RepID=A0A7L6N352_9MOLU|nr:23S rRNA (uracil(1939)-C(5))-methyltransferase RlmD [Hujiaoplasma nucleasis]QLY40706.1 23S rRNA (uracil(1939)-C(5))-methyltransferase RlmD [Hujiaoplasma nucleasis]
MMKLIEKQKLKLNIRKQGINGEGIGYFNRVAVFVPGAIRKEVVNVEVEKVYDNYAVAKIIDIERPSTKRVLPPCKYYDQCGHCDLQHIEYNEQLKIKQLILEQSFKRYTNLNEVKNKIDKTLNDQEKEHYSTYLDLVLKNTNFGLAMGYYKPMTNHFVYIDQCIIQDKEINQIAGLALKLFRKYKMKAHDFRNKEGTLFNLVIRYFKDTDQASLVIVVNRQTPKLKQIAKELVDTFKSIQSVGFSMYQAESQLLVHPPVEVLAGQERLITRYHGLECHVSLAGAYPNHLKVSEMMDENIVKYTGMAEDDLVLNLYEQSSVSSLFFAQYAEKVIAIDYLEDSILDAKINIKNLAIKNIELIQDHVEAVLPKLLKNNDQTKIVILNAPKHGLSQTTIDLLNKYKVDQVVYISQNPSSLAKDMDRLMMSYSVSKIIPVDLYPQTARIDSLTFMNRL